MDLSLVRFEHRLSEHRPEDIENPRLRRSAVAIVLRYERSSPDILLMKRAEREGDRWSGQISLPGGRESDRDRDLQATAMRETHEEVGIDLERAARPIGRLDTIQARARGGLQPLTITPFVFVQTRVVELVLNHEAQDAFWLPFDRVVGGELTGKYPYKIHGLPAQLPCWRYEGHVIWGLTHRILSQLIGIVE